MAPVYPSFAERETNKQTNKKKVRLNSFPKVTQPVSGM
jgi:hypothetical protein